MMAIKDLILVAIHVLQAITRLSFLLWYFDCMGGGVSELSSAPWLSLVALPLPVFRTYGGSALVLTVLVLVLFFVLVLIRIPHLWHPSASISTWACPVTRASAFYAPSTVSFTTPCESEFGTWDGHQNCGNNSNVCDYSADLDETNIKEFTSYSFDNAEI